MPLHLLPNPRHSLGAQQFRHHSTFLGRRAYQSARLVRYYIGSVTTRQYAYDKSLYPRRVRSTRTRRLAQYLKEKLIDAHRAFATHPIRRRDYGWIDAPTGERHAQAEQDQQPLTHLDKTGAARMVEITGKLETKRVAVAIATLLFSNNKTYDALCSQQVVKGNAEAVARLAAIQAAKKTSDLVPLAHPSIGITAVNVDVHIFGPEDRIETHKCYTGDSQVSELWSREGGVTITSTVKCEGKTGVEMEALTASTIGAVTMYDMLKAIDKGMVIMGARVVQKEGGKSGDWVWDDKKNERVPPLDVVSGPPVRSKGLTSRPSQEAAHESPKLAKTVTSRPQTSNSDIDEWNQGLGSEFSVPESSQSRPSERDTSWMNSSRIILNEERARPSERGTNTPSRETDMTDPFFPTAGSKSVNIPSLKLEEVSSQVNEMRTSIRALEFRLHSIQKSRFIGNVIKDKSRKDGDISPLNTGDEWHPYTMSPVTRDDLTSGHTKVNARDFREKQRQRYENEGGGSGGSIIR